MLRTNIYNITNRRLQHHKFTFTYIPTGITAEIIIPSFTINSDFVGLSNTNPIPVL